MAKEDPITCASMEKTMTFLISQDGSLYSAFASHTVKFAWLCQQAKLHTERQSPTHKFGIILPIDQNHALIIDKDNDDRLQELSNGIEVNQVVEYDTFCNLGRGAKPPRDHQPIRVHFVFNVKDDLHCKSCLVAGGHMTAPPKDSISSGVVTLRSLRL
jgi:hypothetical protein